MFFFIWVTIFSDMNMRCSLYSIYILLWNISPQFLLSLPFLLHMIQYTLFCSIIKLETWVLPLIYHHILCSTSSLIFISFLHTCEAPVPFDNIGLHFLQYLFHKIVLHNEFVEAWSTIIPLQKGYHSHSIIIENLILLPTLVDIGYPSQPSVFL